MLCVLYDVEFMSGIVIKHVYIVIYMGDDLMPKLSISFSIFICLKQAFILESKHGKKKVESRSVKHSESWWILHIVPYNLFIKFIVSIFAVKYVEIIVKEQEINMIFKNYICNNVKWLSILCLNIFKLLCFLCSGLAHFIEQHFITLEGKYNWLIADILENLCLVHLRVSWFRKSTRMFHVYWNVSNCK